MAYSKKCVQCKNDQFVKPVVKGFETFSMFFINFHYMEKYPCYLLVFIGSCAKCFMLCIVIIYHSVSQLPNKALIPERTEEVAVHPSPLKATALSNPGHGVVSSIIHLQDAA